MGIARKYLDRDKVMELKTFALCTSGSCPERSHNIMVFEGIKISNGLNPITKPRLLVLTQEALGIDSFTSLRRRQGYGSASFSPATSTAERYAPLTAMS